MFGSHSGNSRSFQVLKMPSTRNRTRNLEPIVGSEIVDNCYLTAAITFSSIAIGVGNAVTSIVVRVGFGLAGPAKYSA
jgi:hypothetical protein